MNIKEIIAILSIMRLMGIEISIYENNVTNHVITVFKYNEVAKEFYLDKREWICCERGFIYMDEGDKDETNFSIILNKSEKFNKNEINAFLIDNRNFSLYEEVSKDIKEINGDNDDNIVYYNLKIFNVCKAQKANYDINIITVKFLMDEKYETFFYIKKCFDRKRYPSIGNRSILIILILGFAFGIIYSCTRFYYIDKEIDSKNIKITINKQGIIIKWYYGLFACIISFILVKLINVFDNIILKITNFFSFVIIVPFILYILFIILFKKTMKLDKFPDRARNILKKTFFTIKIYKLLSFIISLLLITLFHFNNYWFISNLYFTGIIFVIVSKFYIENFSNIVLFNAWFILYDLLWILNSLFYSHNSNSTSLERALQLFKLTLPYFSMFNPNHPCIYISWVDIIMTCLVIKYAKSFDIMKNNARGKYFNLSILLVFIGFIFVTIGELFIYATQIYLFPSEIIIVIGLIVVSSYFREFEDFWYGKNNIGMMNEVNDIIKNVDRIDEEIEAINVENQ